MNRYLVLAGIMGTMLMGMTTISKAGGSTAPSVEQYSWQKRLLIIFAGNADSAALSKQRATIEGSKGFPERDLLVIEVIGNDVQGVGDSASALRQRYGVKAGTFRVLLVGKDGGVKLDSHEPIESRELFKTIDAMPMRKQEAAGRGT
ncbi:MULTISPECIES: DUF4174 domain-containing protein [unclassified Caballeronia]|uniref:DUF4174 domain-containing protein n=1 Tax=unclassified Caballeronia TaxID=2646786 RepID=UPI00285D3B65|nr:MULTISPECIES: DUF4174 domain-containing protein [unclassified Caballeronia]MDR5815203.1 DUF4174 domain-containing protein [Caballeronia sp. LZ033]MDR5822655.1 DUF4174 domain-containing protein [Caballeronia sp. LZ043]MDR5879940.1 DUF4174 domain-containing protein [Caballeronia sp. LZ032]